MKPDPDPEAAGEELYDAYLDAALRGEEPEPEAWCAARGGAPEQVVESLRSLRRVLETRPADPRPAADSVTAEDGLPFERLGEFRLVRRLGTGGMGVVYLAIQESLGRAVALKVIRPELAASPTAAVRLRQEALAVARLRHPNLAAVHAQGEDRGARWIALELIPGRNLDEILAAARDGGEAVPPSALVRWAAEIASALACAHDAGLVHRDVKPSNIRVTPEGRAVLLDFGLARDLAASGPTLTGSFAGSPWYAAPEQISAGRGEIGPRTDVYALGVTLYEGLTGAVPFDDGTLDRLHHRILTEDPAPPRRRNPAVARDLEVVVLKAMEKDPAHRYASVRDLGDDLRAVLELRPVRAKPSGPLARGAKWARRNRAPALAIAAAALALLAVPAALAVRAARARAEARAEAAELRAEAGELLRQAEEHGQAYSVEYWKAQRLRTEQRSGHSSPDADARLEASARAAEERRRDRDVAFVRATARISQAQGLDPESSEIEALWSWFYYLKWTEHRNSTDKTLPDLYRALVREHDRGGEWLRRVEGRVKVRLGTSPPGAEVHLFRWVAFEDPAAGAARRLVAEPCFRQESEGDPHAVAAAPAGPIPGPESLCGRSPFGPVELEAGWYLAVFRQAGFETKRLPFHVDHPDEDYSRELDMRRDLLPEGTTPAGFVHVGGGKDAESETPFWIQEREVTVAEYRVFLDSGAALAGAPPGWTRDGDGRWRAPAEASDEWPILGVSWHDARAYAAWRGRQPDLASRELTPGLPRRREWVRAAKGGDSRTFVHGNAFHPKWVKSRHAKAVVGPEPVRSYPVDESPIGVFDLAGSAAEWLDPPAGREDEWGRTIAGGSWEDEDAARFECAAFRTLDAGTRSPSVGFRLVLRRSGEGR